MAESSFDEILERIAKSPDIIEKINSITKGTSSESPYDRLPEIMAAISPALGEEKERGNEEKTDTPPDKSPFGALDLPIAKIGEKIAKNSKLLIALKPYLCKERCEIIDTVVQLAQVTDLMKLAK